jgi:leucine dehydrogenase
VPEFSNFGPFCYNRLRFLGTSETSPKEEESMETLLKDWDGESVIIGFDRPAGAWIIIAIHSTRLGPAIGGTRMKSYPDLQAALRDAQRLASGMTYKWAAAGIDSGGGKAVIAVPPGLDPKARGNLLRRYGAFVHKHRGLFLTGPDLGTSSEDMDIIAEKAPEHVFGRTPAAGGGGNPATFTARGVFTAMQVTAQHLFDDASLAGKRVVVQGVGSVGRQLIDLLRGAGAEILFTDVNEPAIQYFRDELNLQFVPSDDVYDTACDIFAPCAIGGILNQETIPRLRCPAVVGAANNQLGMPEDAARLQERGILYAPDFVANSGGAIALIGIETKGWSHAEAMERMAQLVEWNMSQIFELTATAGITPDEAARRLAEKRLSGAAA